MAPLVERRAAEFAAFLEHYWHDGYTAAGGGVGGGEAAGGRILTGGQDGPWVDGQCTGDLLRREKLGVVVWQHNDMSTPAASSTMRFRDADVHVDKLIDIDDDLAVFDGPDLFGFTEGQAGRTARRPAVAVGLPVCDGQAASWLVPLRSGSLTEYHQEL